MGLAAMAVLFLFVYEGDFGGGYPYIFLLPWILGLLIVFAIPPAILYRRGELKLHDPLVYATWSYFFPAFGIGGIILAFGWSEPYYLNFVDDPAYNLPLTIVLIAAGYLGLAVGYFLPIGRRLGEGIDSFLPLRSYIPSSLVVPGFVLLGSGIALSMAALFLGIIGYQKVVEASVFDGLIYLTTMFWLEASFVLWCVVVSRRGLTLQNGIIAAVLVGASLAKALMAGNRGTLLQLFLTVVLAYTLSGHKIDFKRGVWAGALLFFCLLGGMVYGTSFRNLKGGETEASVDRYVDNVFDTIDHVARSDQMATLQFGMTSLAERLEAVSSVGVVVSRYEQLKPYEESYGLNDNIWKDTVTFFVPRVLWKDKPVASDARKYSDLYFEYGENSFTVTPIGDLLRNFGVVGIPIGMLLLGVLLRMVYRALIEDQPFVIWRGTIYFMLLTSTSYEGFYGTIIPLASKIGFISALGILIVCFFATRDRRFESIEAGRVARAE